MHISSLIKCCRENQSIVSYLLNVLMLEQKGHCISPSKTTQCDSREAYAASGANMVLVTVDHQHLLCVCEHSLTSVLVPTDSGSHKFALTLTSCGVFGGRIGLAFFLSCANCPFQPTIQTFLSMARALMGRDLLRLTSVRLFNFYLFFGISLSNCKPLLTT